MSVDSKLIQRLSEEVKGLAVDLVSLLELPAPLRHEQLKEALHAKLIQLATNPTDCETAALWPGTHWLNHCADDCVLSELFTPPMQSGTMAEPTALKAHLDRLWGVCETALLQKATALQSACTRAVEQHGLAEQFRSKEPDGKLNEELSKHGRKWVGQYLDGDNWVNQEGKQKRPSDRWILTGTDREKTQLLHEAFGALEDAGLALARGNTVIAQARALRFAAHELCVGSLESDNESSSLLK